MDEKMRRGRSRTGREIASDILHFINLYWADILLLVYWFRKGKGR